MAPGWAATTDENSFGSALARLPSSEACDRLFSSDHSLLSHSNE